MCTKKRLTSNKDHVPGGSRRGFTLVEILVVIAIIGILVTVIYGNFTNARQNTQNRSLANELKEVQLALESYRAQEGRFPAADHPLIAQYDTNGGSPPGDGPCFYPDTPDSNSDQVRSDECGNFTTQYIRPLVEAGFVSRLPEAREYQNSECTFVYTVSAAGDWYRLEAERCLGGVDATTGTQPDDELAPCREGECGGDCDPSTADFYESLAVYSPGPGQCDL